MRPTSRLATLAGMVALVVPFGVAAMAAPAGAVGTPAPGSPAATTSAWPQFGHSPPHLGTNPAEKTFSKSNISHLHTLFTADFGTNTLTEGGPAVANGVIYVGGFDGNLNAYPAAGCGQPSCQRVQKHVLTGVRTAHSAGRFALAVRGDRAHRGRRALAQDG